MNRLERRIERDLRQIADRATPSTSAWDSILTRIADLEPDSETEIIMLTEATPRSSRRWLSVAAAAVVAVIAVTGVAFAISRDDESVSPAAMTVAPDTVAPPPTVAPTTVAAMETVRFTVIGADIPVAFTVPDDWNVEDRVGASKGDGIGEVGLHFDVIPNIYADGCQWVPLDPPVGPSVDDLAEAWADLPQYEATAAVDVTVDGYTGKQIEFTVPGYNSADCKGADSPVFGLWKAPDHAFPGFGAQGPDQRNEQQILDVDGTRLVITAYDVPSASPQDLADLEEALASIQIG